MAILPKRTSLVGIFPTKNKQKSQITYMATGVMPLSSTMGI